MLSLRTVESLKEMARERGWSYETHQPAATLRFPPSRTTMENVSVLLNNCSKWLGAWEARLSPKMRHRATLTYARLYAVAPYSIPESFSCVVPSAYLIGPEGVVGTADGELLVQSHVDQGAPGTRRAVHLAQPDFARAPALPGTHLSLRAYCDHNYCHWLLNCLPRLTMLSASDLAEAVKLILPFAPLKPFHLQTLRLFGIDDSRLVQLDQGCVAVERMIVCQPTPKTNVPMPAHLFAMTDHVKKAVLATDAALPANARRRVYVTRRTGWRSIVNEEELRPIIQRFGFEIVDCEALSFAEQVRLFAETKVVLGPHGAGLSNHMFCPPGATVIEIYNPLLWHDNVQRTAGLYQHDHWHLHGLPIVDPTRYDVSVTPESLRDLLTLACPR